MSNAPKQISVRLDDDQLTVLQGDKPIWQGRVIDAA